MIVKIYQGPVTAERLLEDVKSVPGNPADRIRRALLFAGTVFQSVFQRNDFTYGVSFFQHGYLQQAEASFKQVIAAKPDNPGKLFTTWERCISGETPFPRRANIWNGR